MLLPFIGPELNEPATPILILALAGFSLARYLTDLRGTVVVGAFVMLLSGDVLLTSDDSDLSNVVFVAAVLLPPYGFGLVTRALADRNRKLAEQAELLSRLQEAVKREAVAAERTRIARELHDVIAHSISAMIVQASAARELIGGDERRAAIALDAVTSAGRRALQETGRLLHLIRDEKDELGLSPDLDLDRLDDLVEQFIRSGLQVTVAVAGSLAALPGGVAVSGYRIVQEALTNALKYATDQAASLRIACASTALVIETENRGSPEPGTGTGSGSGLGLIGLIGMAERVSVFGGSLNHGFTNDGRFLLSATLPLTGGET